MSKASDKSKPYIFTHNPKFIIYLTFEMRKRQYNTMQYKMLLNNNKILNRKRTVYTNKEIENVAMKHDMKKAYFTSTTYNISKIVYHTCYLLNYKIKDFLII